MRLEGKTAIVTGGARGIGRAIVQKFAQEGALVTFLDLDVEAAGETRDPLTARGLPVEFIRTDVTSEVDVHNAVAAVALMHGTIDILVNNAGVNAYFDAAEMTEAQWDTVFAVDLKGAWLCAKHVLPSMKLQQRGSIVNISSIHSTLTIAGICFAERTGEERTHWPHAQPRTRLRALRHSGQRGFAGLDADATGRGMV